MADPPATLLATLGDTSRSAGERRMALRQLSTLAFNKDGFAPHRANFLQTLRDLTGDGDTELQDAAFVALMQDRDSLAENLLIQGLQNPSQAVVPAAVALELLRLDPHAATATVARDVLTNSADPNERAQAAHLLAADSTAASLLLALLVDKTESAAVRQAAAIGLRGIDEADLTAAARAIVADTTDDWAVRAICRTLLTLLLPDEFDFDDEDALG